VSVSRQLYESVLRMLRGIPPAWWIVLAAAAVILFALRHKRAQIAGNLLILYILFVLIAAVFSRARMAPGWRADMVNLDLIGTWKERYNDMASGKVELLTNYLMLLPVGFLFPLTGRGGFLRTMLLGLCVTVSIEALQLITMRGFFELVDIADNTVSVAAGFFLSRLCSFLWRRLHADSGT